jgi:putative heme-binding domain-containing protein
MNRELIRVLVYLQESSILDRYLTYLRSDVPEVDKLHVAIHLRFLETGWKPEQRLELLKFYEEAQTHKGGGSYARYVINATRDFGKTFTEEESRLVLAKGADWPNAALGALYKLPAEVDDETRRLLTDLDRQLKDNPGDSAQRLQVGIVAVLARSGDDESMAYLRKVWDEDPERRKSVTIGLAQKPDGENWSYLVRSFPALEPAAAKLVFSQLMTVPQAPEEAEPYRQVILLGLKMKEKGADTAVELLSFWNGEDLAAEKSVDEQLVAWQAWFAKTYPDLPAATLPIAPEDSKYSFEELVEFLQGEDAAKGNSSRGSSLFVRAQCAKCHRFGERGESLGPDLTNVKSRFTKKELLESIFYPSHVISSQYASKTILTTDGRTLNGIVAPGAAGETVVLQANGEKVTLAAEEIEATKPSKESAMPAGLLNTLTLEEIADLFVYLESGGKTSLSQLPDTTDTK